MVKNLFGWFCKSNRQRTSTSPHRMNRNQIVSVGFSIFCFIVDYLMDTLGFFFFELDWTILISAFILVHDGQSIDYEI